MKFGQLIEYNRNIFLEKLYAIYGAETIPRTFSHEKCFLVHLKSSFRSQEFKFLS